MKLALTILLSVAAACAFGQKFSGSFKLKPGSDYLPGNVLVKVKEGYQEQVTQLTKSKTSARIKSVPMKSVAPIVKPELARKGATLRGPRVYKPTIDISRYFTIRFDAGQNIETYINQLYSTGYFDIIEPVYAHSTNYTPNDPLINNQYFLGQVKAYQAWDISKGDTAITIAIVDSGGYLNHVDLAPQLYTNWAEYPPNGIDDDGNGYVDDYRGWDFAGTDTLAIGFGTVVEDNDPNVPNNGLQSHGSWVAGCASAATDNGTGVAGVGFKTRIMFTKHSADNQNPNKGSVYFGFSGLLYAANQGIKIINLSWGGGGKSQIEQDIINHVTVDLGCLVIAAAGNNNSGETFYPAGYDHVLSVAATDEQDAKASFSNYGKTVDLSAPGVSIGTTGYNNGYYLVNGTSFSAPITSGAAALVWAHNPSFTWDQVAEQLRATADATALYSANSSFFANQLGKGRLNINRALTVTTPSIRATNTMLVAGPAGKSYLSFDFTNHLASTGPGLQISINSSGVGITKGSFNPGAIVGGATISNKQNPFELTVSPTVAENTMLTFLITYTDGDYSDFQYVDLIVNRSYVDVTTARVGTTVTNIGRLGFQDPASSSLGQGFTFDQQQMLFEMGLIMGTSSTQLYSNVRGATGEFTDDFISLKQISQSTPGARSASEVSGEFSNSTLPSKQAVMVDYTSLEWKDSPYDKFVIMEYKIKNPAAAPLTNFYFGVFADWDITTWDAVDWSDPEKLSYVYSPVYEFAPYAGIQVLTGAALHYAIDNDANVPGNPFGVYDGFTNAEKFQTISSTRDVPAPGLHGSQDVSHVVSSGPYTINPGETITVAFAIHGAANLNDLKTSALWADSVYNYTLKAVQPSADSVATCYGSTATLNASGPTLIKWYTNPVGGQSFFTGNQVTTDNLFGDTTLYVSNADQSFESVRTPVVVTARANPTIFTSGSTIFCQGNFVQLSVAVADSILWNTGEKTTTITVSESGSYSVTLEDVALDCQLTSEIIEVTVNPGPNISVSISAPLEELVPIEFKEFGTGSISWQWDFGDGKTSTDQNPRHTYTHGDDYLVSLITTNLLGCTSFVTTTLPVITGLTESNSDGLSVFPNPVSGQILRIEISDDHLENASVQLTNTLGQVVFEQAISTPLKQADVAVPASILQSGLYVVKLNLGTKTVIKKVIKVD